MAKLKEVVFDVVTEECNLSNTKPRFGHLEYNITFFAAYEEDFKAG